MHTARAHARVACNASIPMTIHTKLVCANAIMCIYVFESNKNIVYLRKSAVFGIFDIYYKSSGWFSCWESVCVLQPDECVNR